MNAKKQLRRRNALKRAEIQLKSGMKLDEKTDLPVPLTEKNIKRIQKEIATLKAKI